MVRGIRGEGRASFVLSIGVVVAGGALVAGGASAHTGPIPIPPESNYLIRWYQPHSVQPVRDWEIEIAPQRSPGQRTIASAQVAPDDSCWALTVPVSEPANVRMRSVYGSQRSEWSRWTTVPEPALGLPVAAGTALLARLARRRRATREPSANASAGAISLRDRS